MSENPENKVFVLLDALKPQEYRKFVRWLYYKHPKWDEDLVVKLYHIIKNRDSRNSEYILSQLFPGKQVKESRLRRIFAKLTEDIQDFMVVNSVLENDSNYNIYLTKELHKREVKTWIGSILKKATQKIYQSRFRNNDDFLCLYFLENLHQEYLLKFDQKKEKRREEEINIALDKWIVAEKLKLALMNITLEKFQGKSLDTLLIDEIHSIIHEHQYLQKEPIIQLWSVFNKMYSETEQTDVNYHKAKDLLKLHQKHMNQDLLLNLFIGITNYKSFQVNKTSNREVLKDLLELYQWGVKDKLLHINGRIRARQLKNLIMICIRLGLYDMGKAYLDQLQADLHEEDRDVLIKFFRVRFLFHDGKFQQVRQLLNQPDYLVENMNVYIKISCRNLFLMVNYELGVRTDLETHVHAYKEFFRTHKQFSATYADFSLKFIKLFSRLLEVSSIPNLRRLQRDAKEQLPYVESDWLINKIEDAIQGYNK